MLSLSIIRFPENRDYLWEYVLISSYNIASPYLIMYRHLQAPEIPNPRLQASLLRVAIMVARELQEDLKEELYTEVRVYSLESRSNTDLSKLLYTVIPLSNNNKVAVRHQATSMVLELWDDLIYW